MWHGEEVMVNTPPMKYRQWYGSLSCPNCDRSLYDRSLGVRVEQCPAGLHPELSTDPLACRNSNVPPLDGQATSQRSINHS